MKRQLVVRQTSDPLKGRVTADLVATAHEVSDPVERREILEKVARAWRRTDLDAMVAYSPLIEVTLPA